MLGRVWLVAFVLFVAGEAQAADVKRVAFRVTDPTSRALMQRVRGQTSDLDLELVEASEPALETHVGDEVATAVVLARRLDARIVVWFEEGSGGITLFFSLPGEGRTLVRTMPEESGARAPSSATFEASALVVRSVLRALASGATIGVTLAAPLDIPVPLDVPAHEAAAPAAAPKTGAPLREVPASRGAGPWGWSGALGYHATLVDPRTLLQGAEARAGVSRAGLTGGLQLTADAPATLADPDATVKLLRLAGGAFASYGVSLGERWTIALGAAGGVVGFHRETVSVATGVTRAPDSWIGSALIGPEAGVSCRARVAGLSLGIGLRAGADVVLTPPLIGNAVAGAFVSEHALWSVEPKLVLQVEMGSR